MDVTGIVSVNIRRIREQKKLTLDAAAEVTGVSRSMLAQIEKGDVNPTISVLWKIANGYRTPFTALVENTAEEVTVLRAAERSALVEDGGRYINYPTFPFDEKTLFETCHIVIEPGGTLSAQPHLRGSAEYITVFAGQVEITVAEETFTLSAGDSIRFRADVFHAYRSGGPERAELSMIIFYGKQ